MEYVVRILVILCWVLIVAISIRAIMSWFMPDPNNPFVSMVHTITEPILAPLRRIIPRLDTIDLSPWVAIILLYAALFFLNRI